MHSLKKLALLFISFISISLWGGNKKLDSLWTKYNSAASDTEKAWLMNLVGEEYFNFNTDSAMLFWNRAEKFALEKIRNAEGKELLSYKRTLAELLNSKGAYYLQAGDDKKTIELWQKSVAIRKETNDKYGVCLSLINMGFLYYGREDYPKAADCWTQGERLAEEIKNYVLVAHARNALGGLYHSMGEIDKSYSYFNEVLEYKLKNKDYEDIGTVYSNIATLESERHNTPKAFSFIAMAIDNAKKTNQVASLGNYYNFVATLMLDEKKYDSAYYYLKICEKIFTENSMLKDLGHTQNLFARGYYEQKDYKTSKEYALRSLETGRAVKSKTLVKDADFHLKNIFFKEQDYKNAYTYFSEYVSLKDSIQFRNDKSSALKKQLQFDYEREKLEIRKEQEKTDLETEAEAKKQKIIIFSIGGGFLLLAVFSFLLFNRFRIISRQKSIIEVQRKEMQHQKEIVEEKNKEIVDSINYAKRIQYTLLANQTILNENIPGNFILFKPKDIVSGDFYWATKKENRFYLAVCDSTGHGVPGAFMCLLNISFLNEATSEKNITQPNEIFNYIRKRLIENISQEGAQDGMDGVLVCFESHESTNTPSQNNPAEELKTISYVAANNSPVFISNSELTTLPCDKMPVGKGERSRDFISHTISPAKGSCLFIYTDGFADQFGGPKGKKFKYKQLNELLLSISELPSENQKNELESAFSKWKGKLEQVDDVLLMGIKC